MLARGQGQEHSGGSGRSSLKSCCHTSLLFHPLLEVIVPWQNWQKYSVRNQMDLFVCFVLLAQL